MRFSRITPTMLIAIFTLLALLMIYLALNAAFWNMVGRCGSFCNVLMSETFIRMITK